jgi:hypothetical protein
MVEIVNEKWTPLDWISKRRRDEFLKKYRSVRRYYDGFAEYSMRGTEKTFAQRISILVNFISFLETDPDIARNEQGFAKDPDSIVQQRLEDLKSTDFNARDRWERIVKKFATKAYKNNGKYSRYVLSIIALKGFFRYNGGELNVRLPRRILAKPRAIVSINEVRKMFNVADIREKVALALLVLGPRPETLLQMKYGMIRHAIECREYPCPIYFSQQNLKGAYAPYYFFVSQEACELFEDYLELRKRGTGKIPPEKIDDSSPLLRKEDSFEPLTYKGLMTIVKKLARLTFLDKEVVPYAFRRFFQTSAEASGIPLNWVDYLMMHFPRGADACSYSQPSVDQLKSAFSKVEHQISMRQNPAPNEQDVKKDMLQGFARFAGINLDEAIKNKGLKSIDNMNETEIGALFDDFRKALMEQALNTQQPRVAKESSELFDHPAPTSTKKFLVAIAKSKSELIEKSEDGWELIRELEDGEFLMRRDNTNP